MHGSQVWAAHHHNFEKAVTTTQNMMKGKHKVSMEDITRPALDLVDSLRALGIEQDFAIPQIAVMGDQSSGKSSVLEAISGIPFPRGSGLVTRCATQITMKRTAAGTPWVGSINVRFLFVCLFLCISNELAEYFLFRSCVHHRLPIQWSLICWVLCLNQRKLVKESRPLPTS